MLAVNSEHEKKKKMKSLEEVRKQCSKISLSSLKALDENP